jgi:hypothetical protein
MKALYVGIILFLLAACSQETEKEKIMTGSIQEVKVKYEQQIIETPGVVSMGIGKDAKGNTAIIIGIEQESEGIRAVLPKELDGYPVEVKATGPARAQ